MGEGNNLLKKRSLLSGILAITLGFGGIFANGGNVQAATLSDLQNEQSKIQSKRSDVTNSIDEKDNQISEIVNRQAELTLEVKRLELQINDTNAKIEEKHKQIEDTKAEIERLKAEIEVLIEKIEQRHELLQERARNIQMNGGSVNYLDVLLGSISFGDFIDRFSAVTTLVNADKKIMEEQRQDMEQLEANQLEVEKKLESLSDMLEELEVLKANLKSQNEKKKVAMKELAKQKQHIESEKMGLEEEAAILSAQNAAIQQEIKNEKTRIAEEAAQRAREEAAEKDRIEAERKAQEAAEAAQSENKQSSSSTPKVSNSGSSAVNSSNTSHSKPVVTSGSFMRPAMGRLSSEHGYRSFNGGGMHHGVDIAAKGTVPIVAAAAGTVISSYFSSSYGNVIFIRHNLNGKTFTTVYAHLNSRSVSAGSSVSKGQFIGNMGNTGRSFGQHLHFELHEGDWNGAKSNSVNPRKHINF